LRCSSRDLKGLLAYSTISHLGLITKLLGLGSPLACVAAIFHMANHATFKASLFMAAGIIDHETGTRDMRRLTGLFRYMPFTGALAIIASVAMAGVPLLNDFLSKEMFFAQAVEVSVESWLDRATPYIATMAGLFSVTYCVRFIHGVFFGAAPQNLPKVPPMNRRLTGDIFNLFVFFEIMLTASYALVLHGSGVMRIRAGMHYVVINLLASSCFLIGVAMIYGVAGTLNMADLAARLPGINDDNQRLFAVGAAVIGAAFLVKTGMWPLSFWLPSAYSAAVAPVGAFFVILKARLAFMSS